MKALELDDSPASKRGAHMATARELVDKARNKIEANKEAAAAVGATYKFVLEGEGGGTWIWTLTDHPSIVEGDGDAPCTIRMSAEDYVAMREGRADAQQLFFAQQLKVEGDVSLAMKLQTLNDLIG
jgi:putative sterol carrier protein